MKPVVFIGSSKKQIAYAEAIQTALTPVAHIKLWSDNVFEPSKVQANSLYDTIKECDFAILILSADDETKSPNGKSSPSPRDNVILEVGLGFGLLGLERIFLARTEEIGSLKLPSDLAGVTLAKKIDKSASSPELAVEAVSREISNIIKNNGKKKRSLIQINGNKETLISEGKKLIDQAHKHIIMFGGDLSWVKYYKDELKSKSQKAHIEIFGRYNDEEALKNKEALQRLNPKKIKVHLLDPGPKIKMTMIDYDDKVISKFMISKKIRTSTSTSTEIAYSFQIEDAKTEEVTPFWDTLVNLYELLKWHSTQISQRSERH